MSEPRWARWEDTPLSGRDRAILAHLRLGHANKLIALELGLSESSVSTALRGLAARVGARSRLELVRWLTLGDAGDDSTVPEPSWPPELTDAERAVASLLLKGASNAEIAARRGTSPRTVVNQVASVYRKTHVASRIELAARVFGQ